MTWGWSPRKEPLSTGGRVGTPAEAKQPGAWVDYEAEYLKHRLENPAGRFADPPVGIAAKSVYLDKVSSNYKEEADACLKMEFNDWLQGKHETNQNREKYVNEGTKPKRRHIYDGEVGTPKEGWVAADWGDAQLTHLPGVRDYLRGMAKHKDDAELQMNLLAEHGPQNLEEAWMYFKHWVKGRPVGVDTCAHPRPRSPKDSKRSDFGFQAPRMSPPASPPSGDSDEIFFDAQDRVEPSSATLNDLRQQVSNLERKVQEAEAANSILKDDYETMAVFEQEANSTITQLEARIQAANQAVAEAEAAAEARAIVTEAINDVETDRLDSQLSMFTDAFAASRADLAEAQAAGAGAGRRGWHASAPARYLASDAVRRHRRRCVRGRDAAHRHGYNATPALARTHPAL